MILPLRDPPSQGYTLEGTKKNGASLKTKKKLLAKTREQAEKISRS